MPVAHTAQIASPDTPIPSPPQGPAVEMYKPFSAPSVPPPAPPLRSARLLTSPLLSANALIFPPLIYHPSHGGKL
ncbi:hypothetical protein WMY93_029721 [Mugilogobius chulae]|uniref:Uncharacterized protein n=1 Tax=Mugilogobius chulae TaxID=88201 RepID=A0AAW0MKN0_9GOBI